MKARPGHLRLEPTQDKVENRKTTDGRDKFFQTACLFSGTGRKSCQPSLSAQAAEPALRKDTAWKIRRRDSGH